MTDSGKLVLFSGPSGVGKDTLLDILAAKCPELQRSVSLTTRAPRENETDGVDYYFVSSADFEKMLQDGEVLEFAQYGKYMYGTPKRPVDRWLQEGKTVVLKIEVQGAAKIKKIYPHALAIFIMPPSMEILEKRLRRRGTEDEDDLLRRMAIARDEVEKRHDYDFVVTNDDLEEAANAVLRILRQES